MLSLDKTPKPNPKPKPKISNKLLTKNNKKKKKKNKKNKKEKKDKKEKAMTTRSFSAKRNPQKIGGANSFS